MVSALRERGCSGRFGNASASQASLSESLSMELQFSGGYRAVGAPSRLTQTQDLLAEGGFFQGLAGMGEVQEVFQFQDICSISFSFFFFFSQPVSCSSFKLLKFAFRFHLVVFLCCLLPLRFQQQEPSCPWPCSRAPWVSPGPADTCTGCHPPKALIPIKDPAPLGHFALPGCIAAF